MGLWTKITKLFLLTAFMLQPSFAWCEEIDPLEAMPVEAFARANDFDLMSIKAIDPNSNIIKCGDSWCDLNVNNCYLVHYNYNSGGKNKDGTPKPRTSGGAVAPSGTNAANEDKCLCQQNPPTSSMISSIVKKTDICVVKQGISLGVINSQSDVVPAESSDGRSYSVRLGVNATIIYGLDKGEKGAFFGCEVLPIKLYHYKKCFFCNLVGVVYNGTAKFADISFTNIAQSFAKLLAVGFAIWIAIQILGHVSSLTKQDAPKFLGNLLRQSFKVLVAIILLYYPTNIFKYAFNPLLYAGLEFGGASISANALGKIKSDQEYAQVAEGSPGGAYLNNNTYKKIENFVVTVNTALSQMQAVGGAMMCTGGRIIAINFSLVNWSDDAKESKMVDGFSIWIQGTLILVFGFLLSLAFVFYLLDAVVQMGIVGGLLPLMVAAWPFKATANYTKVGVDMFMNSVFTFAFIGMIISIDIRLIDEAMSLGGENKNGKGLVAIAHAFHNNEVKEIIELTDITGFEFLILLFCCIYALKLLAEAPSLVNKFASGTLTGKGAIAPKIATMGASAAKSLALKATKDVRKSASDKVERFGKAALHSPYNLGKWAINKMRNKKES